MQQYLLAIHHSQDEADIPPPEVLAEIERDLAAFNAELRATGAFVFAGGLHPASVSTMVDATGDEVVVTDGPFAETKEQLGGLCIVRAPDLDGALALAAKASAATRLPIEVRPFRAAPG